jgi:hypothetical protein
MDANKPDTPVGDHGGAHGVAAEPDRISWRLVVVFGVVVILFTAASMYLVAVLVRGMDRSAVKKDDATVAAAGLQRREDRVPPPPRLQVYAPRHWRDFRDAEVARLSSYGWMDRSSGAVHVPIERAMDLIAVRGVGPLPAAPVALPGLDATPTPASGASEKKP